MLYLMILLLTSGYVTLGSHIHHEYHLINEAKSWFEARNYCSSHYTDLATIGSHGDMKRLVNQTAASGVTAEIWIGLTESGPASWLWSVGETSMSHKLAEYSNWDSSPDSSHHCGGMRTDGKWLSTLCQTALPFVCQEGEGSGKTHIIVLQNMAWRQTQKHCRENYMDLASVSNQAENQALQQMINESGLSLVWIGLFRDEWKWSDQSTSSLRYWESSQPNNDGACTLYNPSAKAWYDRGCTDGHPFYCYKATERPKTVRRIVKMEFKSNSPLNFNDFAVSNAILEQIQKKCEGAKLQWKVQSDGKIFHKKEKKKVNEPSCNNAP